jgi:acyl carrier protein
LSAENVGAWLEGRLVEFTDGAITAESRLSDLQIDSIDLALLLADAEQEFSITIDDAALTELREMTVANMIELIVRRLPSAS